MPHKPWLTFPPPRGPSHYMGSDSRVGSRAFSTGLDSSTSRESSRYSEKIALVGPFLIYQIGTKEGVEWEPELHGEKSLVGGHQPFEKKSEMFTRIRDFHLKAKGMRKSLRFLVSFFNVIVLAISSASNSFSEFARTASSPSLCPEVLTSSFPSTLSPPLAFSFEVDNEVHDTS
ncbi:hypothetical protein PanWU01x14_133140 [Parasponia andersonii]|uniref:Uncharacterized protein n=1 Tax=Parasponia andersonii TaxID=3476 RepID=A0A2P5CQB0_PARAD|nr:hypothetical protein PanWU01x14_133140 [Parasponia andersonii]